MRFHCHISMEFREVGSEGKEVLNPKVKTEELYKWGFVGGGVKCTWWVLRIEAYVPVGLVKRIVIDSE